MKLFFQTLFLTASITLAFSANADSEGEAMYAALGCISCHGQGGKSTDENIPSLAGKDVEWIILQLEYFQSGERKNSLMNAMAPMAEGFEQSIAEYLSSQSYKN